MSAAARGCLNKSSPFEIGSTHPQGDQWKHLSNEAKELRVSAGGQDAVKAKSTTPTGIDAQSIRKALRDITDRDVSLNQNSV